MTRMQRMYLSCLALLILVSGQAHTAQDTQNNAHLTAAAMAIQILPAPINPLIEIGAKASTVSTTYALQALSIEMRSQFAGFLDEVLRQVKSKDFFTLIDRITQEYHPQNDQELYIHILKNVNSVTSGVGFYNKLKALWHQKKILGQQLNQLLGDRKAIHGIIEIGSPATYISTIKLPITGQVTAIDDREKAWYMSRIQTGSIVSLPNNTFVPLNDYAPISEKEIANNSVDVVICFIGLHHCPQEKLETFITSIRRILRPGGVFILRDHDAHNAQMMNIVHAAHTVFNAVMTGESVETEMNEYRNFQELNYWIKTLEHHGFKVGSERLLQKGDPSLNTMLKFTKIGQTDEERIAQLENTKNKDYAREVIAPQDPEWINVDLAKDYAKFLNHTPWYQFPYLDSIKTYWSVFGKSWHTARKKHSRWKVLTSDATQTNVVVGAFTTVEFLAKSIAALPIRLMASGSAALRVQAIVKDSENQIDTIDPRIKVISTEGSIKLIELPRYMEFMNITKKIVATSIEFQKIAGQKEVYCKVRYKLDDKKTKLYNEIDGCKKQYVWTLPTQPEYLYCALLVDVTKLKSVMTQLKDKGIELVYIHDSRDN